MAGDAYIRITVDANSDKLVSASGALETVSISADKAGASLAKIASSSAGAEAGVARVASATAAARVEMGALDGSMGMMLGGLARMAGQSSALAPIIANAFPIFGAVAAVEAFSAVEEKITAMMEKPAKIRGEWQELSNTLIGANVSMEKSIGEVIAKTIELEAGPIPALRYEIGLLSDSAGHLDEVLKKAFDDAGKILNESDLSVFNPEKWFGGGTGDIQQKLKDALPDIQQALNTEGAAAGLAKIDGVLTDLYQKRQNLTASLEASRKSAASLSAAPPDAAIQGALGKVQETVKAEEARADALNRTIAALEQIQKLTAGQASLNSLDKAQKVAALNKDIHAEAMKAAEQEIRDGKEFEDSLHRMAAADLEESKKKEKAAQDLTLAQLHGIELVASAQMKADEARINRMLEAREITPAQAATQLTASVTVAHQKDVDAKKGEIDAEDDPAKKQTLQAQLLAMDITFASQKISIAQNAAREMEKIADEQADRELAANLRAVQARAKIQEDQVAQASTPGKTGRAGISPAQRAAQEIAIEQDKLTKLEAIIEQEIDIKSSLGEGHMAKVQELANQELSIQQQTAEKIAAIQKQAASETQRDWSHALESINGPLTGAVDGMINGTERSSVAFARMGSSILTSGVNAILQWGIKTVEQIIIVEVLEHSSLARRIAAGAAAMTARLSQETATTTAEIAQLSSGAAAKQAVVSTSNAAQTISFAGMAAAAATASAFEEIPFPANLAAAPAAGAAALGEVLAYLPMASAERGGIMGDSPTVTLLHPREMVLPERISQSVQRMAAGDSGGSRSSSGGDMHFHITHSPQINTIDRRGMEDVLEDHADHLVKILKDQLRNGRLTFGR
jgi:hypothetical protein